ncbi:hypothetical protein HY68_05695 [Streptomyces sp. AcH 505]|uniref:sigma factor-like helix-turn-helix DNA-binding protein n=1 Tax=Streptomyces sp. AcH 505 TaxID=352211 RepID=UPI00059195AC|nr:hypothetical protein HY68_05695 [Streptomyces sp. AcH 505]
MGERRTALDSRRAREFESFLAGAAGRLLHAAHLLTGEPPDAAPHAQRLLTAALAATYADWDRLRGEDPYVRARQELATRFARSLWPVRSGRSGRAGVLGPLGRQERVVLVLRVYEGIGEEQTAAMIGLSVERVRVICARAVATMRKAARDGSHDAARQGVRPAPGAAGAGAAGAVS